MPGSSECHRSITIEFTGSGMVTAIIGGPVQMNFHQILLIQLTPDDFRGMFFLFRVYKNLRNERIGSIPGFIAIFQSNYVSYTVVIQHSIYRV